MNCGIHSGLGIGQGTTRDSHHQWPAMQIDHPLRCEALRTFSLSNKSLEVHVVAPTPFSPPWTCVASTFSQEFLGQETSMSFWLVLVVQSCYSYGSSKFFYANSHTSGLENAESDPFHHWTRPPCHGRGPKAAFQGLLESSPQVGERRHGYFLIG